MYRRKKKRAPVKTKDTINPIAPLLDTVLKKRSLGNSFNKFRMIRQCIEKLGEDFGKHMCPVDYNFGTLFVKVDSPVWCQQYSMMKKAILEKINQGQKGEKVRDIRFTVGSFDKSEYILDEEKQENLGKKIDKQILNEEDLDFIQESLKETPPDLQEVSRSMLENFIKYQKYRGESGNGGQ